MGETNNNNTADRGTLTKPHGPTIDRSITMRFVGDWGQANFHRICSWLCQEFCDRAGPQSRVGIWSIRGGGIEALYQVQDGEVQLAVATPAKTIKDALTGDGIFNGHAMPDLRALGVLPQTDRMVLAVDTKFGVKSYDDIRRKKPALRIATSANDGTNFIGYAAFRLLEAHGISEATLNSWGGSLVKRTRPEQCLKLMEDGEVDAVIQEAIMTPWWRIVMNKPNVVPIPAEADALAKLSGDAGFVPAIVRAGFWDTLDHDLPALDFSDFVIVVRKDLPDDVAYLLTWALVETRDKIERQYHHIPPERSPLTYPLKPALMAQTSIPLHSAAKKYYMEAGHLN